MNWLAHLYLSEPAPAFQFGSLLPDLVSQNILKAMPADFQPGIARHRLIDTFTDAHPVTRQSLQRIPPPFRRFGPVLVDIFYDHCLARNWSAYSPVPLSQFADRVYAGFAPFHKLLPEDARARWRQFERDNALCAYADLHGIAEALHRISLRLKYRRDLVPAIAILQSNYDAFAADFAAFFPELAQHVRPPSSLSA